MHARAMPARQIAVTDQFERSMLVGLGSQQGARAAVQKSLQVAGLHGS
jgi:hypothetical protein